MTTLEELQREQRTHDRKYHKDTAFLGKAKKTEHFLWHLTKYAGRIARVLDHRHHGEPVNGDRIVRRALADTAIMVLFLANAHGIDLETLIRERWREIEEQYDK